MWVFQGSILAPQLFNFYFNAPLKSEPALEYKIN